MTLIHGNPSWPRPLISLGFQADLNTNQKENQDSKSSPVSLGPAFPLHSMGKNLIHRKLSHAFFLFSHIVLFSLHFSRRNLPQMREDLCCIAANFAFYVLLGKSPDRALFLF